MRKEKSTKEMGDIRKKALEHYLELLGSISDSELANKYGVGRNTIAAWNKADKWDDIVAETRQSTGKKIADKVPTTLPSRFGKCAPEGRGSS